jgi:hypothetical protein
MVGLTCQAGTAGEGVKTSNYGGGILLSAGENGRGVALTAAHCLKYDLNTVGVHGGSLLWEQPGFAARVREYYVHPDYAPPLGIDLAVLILDGVLTGAQTSPGLAGPDDAGLYTAGTEVTLAGWGPAMLNGVNPRSLQVLALPLVASSSCPKGDRDCNDGFACCKTDSSHGSSPGDSGGPVLGGTGHRAGSSPSSKEAPGPRSPRGSTSSASGSCPRKASTAMSWRPRRSRWPSRLMAVSSSPTHPKARPARSAS